MMCAFASALNAFNGLCTSRSCSMLRTSIPAKRSRTSAAEVAHGNWAHVVCQGGRRVWWTLDSTNLVVRGHGLGHASDACCEGLADDVRCSEVCGPAGDLDEAELCRWQVELVCENTVVPVPRKELRWLISAAVGAACNFLRSRRSSTTSG